MTIEQSTDTDTIKHKINSETAKINWRELQRFFAAGNAVYVDKSLDLVDVALQIANDNSVQVKAWMSNKQVYTVDDQKAEAWYNNDASLWSVVVKPWILIQEI